MQQFAQPSFFNKIPVISLVALFVMCLVMVDGIKEQLKLREELKRVQEHNTEIQSDMDNQKSEQGRHTREISESDKKCTDQEIQGKSMLQETAVERG